MKVWGFIFILYVILVHMTWGPQFSCSLLPSASNIDTQCEWIHITFTHPSSIFTYLVWGHSESSTSVRYQRAGTFMDGTGVSSLHSMCMQRICESGGGICMGKMQFLSICVMLFQEYFLRSEELRSHSALCLFAFLICLCADITSTWNGSPRTIREQTATTLRWIFKSSAFRGSARPTLASDWSQSQRSTGGPPMIPLNPRPHLPFRQIHHFTGSLSDRTLQ